MAQLKVAVNMLEARTKLRQEHRKMDDLKRDGRPLADAAKKVLQRSFAKYKITAVTCALGTGSQLGKFAFTITYTPADLEEEAVSEILA